MPASVARPNDYYLTFDSCDITDFQGNETSFVYETASVVDVFNFNNVIALDSEGMVENITLTIGEHNGMKCVAFEFMEGINLYLYLADEI